MSEGYHIDRKSRFLKSLIVQGHKYKVYLTNGSVYTKDNKFTKFLDEEVIVHIENNRDLYYKNKKNRKGHQKLDELIEHPEVFLNELKDAIKFEEDMIEEERLVKALKKVPY